MERLALRKVSSVLALLFMAGHAPAADEFAEHGLRPKEVIRYFAETDRVAKDRSLESFRETLRRSLDIPARSRVFVHETEDSVEFFYLVQEGEADHHAQIRAARIRLLSEDVFRVSHDNVTLDLRKLAAFTRSVGRTFPDWKEHGSSGLSFEKALEMGERVKALSSDLSAALRQQLERYGVTERSELQIKIGVDHSILFEFQNPPLSRYSTVVFTLIFFWKERGGLDGVGFRVDAFTADFDPSRSIGQLRRLQVRKRFTE